MKKYVKPDLFYENFELSQSVASCNVGGINNSDLNKHTNSGSIYSCYFEYDGEQSFVASNNNCKDYPDVYCYQNSIEGLTFFSS